MISSQNTTAAADTNLAPSARILCVEDDREIASLLTDVLEDHGFSPRFVASAAGMNDVLQREQVDLIVLDLMLPDEDGMSICRRLRQASTVPIIMVTAKGEDIDRILGLELGADDYVVKPFNPRELVARIRALLRRAQGYPVVRRSSPMTFDGMAHRARDPAAERSRRRQDHADERGVRHPLRSAATPGASCRANS